ncbi:MAG: flagellar hook-associated protein FlgK [Clostridiales bacterium]|nr:flagellar hook-associated protein FlgK [Clostridiales bacterium]
MPSQFFGLTISASGLRAANAALNTSANNVSNVNTDGYSRQKVTQEAANALRVFATYGCAGAGVDTVAIERIRDSYYDMRFRNNNSTLGIYDIKKYYTDTLQQYLDDDGTSGFGTIYSSFWTTLQAVSTNSSSTDGKAQFIAAAQNLAEYFNNTAGNLKELQKDVNSEIKLRIDRINSLATEIATLNKQINVIEMTGAAANELRDKRDLMLDELSEIVDIKTQEVAVTDANDPTRETGGTRFIVYIAGGQTLVDGNDYHTLECVSRASNEKINMTDADGLYDIYWDNGNDFNLNNASLGGALKGLVAMRDGNNNQAFAGTVVNVGRTANGQNAEVTVKVTQEYLKDMNKCNLSDTGGSIVIGNTVYFYKSWEFDKATSTYKFEMDDAKCDTIVDMSKIAKEAEVGSNVNYQGIPYYLSQMNEFVRAFAAKVNEIFMSGYGKNGSTGEIFFTAAKAVSGNSIIDSQYGSPDFLSDDNGYYEMTAFNLQISNKLSANADLLGTRSSASVGVEECGKVTELLETLKDKSKFSFRNSTASEFLRCILSDVALNASNAETFYDTYYGIATTIENQRSSISGVDEDEEATNMVRFQNAYTLSSKMMQVLTEVYDRLILETGV